MDKTKNKLITRVYKEVKEISIPKSDSKIREESKILWDSIEKEWNDKFKKFEGSEAMAKTLEHIEHCFVQAVKLLDDENILRHKRMVAEVEGKMRIRAREYNNEHYIPLIAGYKNQLKREYLAELSSKGDFADQEMKEKLVKEFIDEQIQTEGISSWVGEGGIVEWVLGLVDSLLKMIFG